MKSVLNFFSLFFLLFVLGANLFAQSPKSTGSNKEKSSVISRPFDQFPIQKIDNSIYVQVTINGSNEKLFLLDSGASFWLIDDSVAKAMNLKTDSSGSVQGAGAGKVTSTYARNITFGLPGIKTTVSKVTIVNLSGSQPEIAGIIGYDFFKQFVVQINYHTNSVKLYDPKTFTYSGKGTVVPITFKGKQIYVKGRIKVAGKDAVEKDYLVDTGSSDVLNDDIIGEATSENKTATGGVGLGKTFKIQIGYAEKFQMGNLVFTNVNCVTGGQKIGAGLFGNYVVTFDYYHQQMIIE